MQRLVAERAVCVFDHFTAFTPHDLCIGIFDSIKELQELDRACRRQR
jgi:hypothetical protein